MGPTCVDMARCSAGDRAGPPPVLGLRAMVDPDRPRELRLLTMWDVIGGTGYFTAAVLWVKCYKLFGDDRRLAMMDPCMQQVVELELPEYNLWKLKPRPRRATATGFKRGPLRGGRAPGIRAHGWGHVRRLALIDEVAHAADGACSSDIDASRSTIGPEVAALEAAMFGPPDPGEESAVSMGSGATSCGIGARSPVDRGDDDSAASGTSCTRSDPRRSSPSTRTLSSVISTVRVREWR